MNGHHATYTSGDYDGDVVRAVCECGEKFRANTRAAVEVAHGEHVADIARVASADQSALFGGGDAA